MESRSSLWHTRCSDVAVMKFVGCGEECSTDMSIWPYGEASSGGRGDGTCKLVKAMTLVPVHVGRRTSSSNCYTTI